MRPNVYRLAICARKQREHDWWQLAHHGGHFSVPPVNIHAFRPEATMHPVSVVWDGADQHFVRIVKPKTVACKPAGIIGHRVVSVFATS